MKKSVMIKSNKHGISLNLDPEISYSELRERILELFSESGKFFSNAKMAISIEGRNLTNEQLNDVIDIISETTDIEILSVMDNSEVNDVLFQNELKKVYNELDACVAEIYPMSVEDCLRLEFKRSVVIMGNVSKDAEIHTDGSVFVLGSLEGTVYAGELGNTGAKVYANNMNPKCVCIADIPYKIIKPEPEKKRFFGKKKETSQVSPAMLLSLVDNEIQFEIF